MDVFTVLNHTKMFLLCCRSGPTTTECFYQNNMCDNADIMEESIEQERLGLQRQQQHTDNVKL